MADSKNPDDLPDIKPSDLNEICDVIDEIMEKEKPSKRSSDQNASEPPAKVSRKNPDDDDVCLRISNLADSFSDDQLKQYLADECNIKNVRIVSSAGQELRNVYLMFQSTADCKKALEKLETKKVDGQLIEVCKGYKDELENGTDLKENHEESKTVDIWEEDPKGLYGLNMDYLGKIGLKPPLTRWIHICNVQCERNVLKELLEIAGTVLYCNVVHTKTSYAKVMYSHPVEAAQAVSLFNKQVFFGRDLTVTMIKSPPPSESLVPRGLQKLGRGFSKDGKPLQDIVKHLERYYQGKYSAIEKSVISGDNTTEVTMDIEEEKESKPEGKEQHTQTEAKKEKDEAKKEKDEEKKVKDIDPKILEKLKELTSKGVSTREILLALSNIRSRKSPVRRRVRSLSSDSRNLDRPKSSHSDSKKIFLDGPKRFPQNSPRNNKSGSMNNYNNPMAKSMPNNAISVIGGGMMQNSGNNFGINANMGMNNAGGRGIAPFNNMQQGNMAMAQGNMGNMNMAQSNMNMGQGNMHMVPGNMNMPQGNMNMMQGNMNMMTGNMNMAQGMRPSMMANMMGNMNTNNLFLVMLSNLPASVTFQILRDKMGQCGDVKFMKQTNPGCAVVGYGNRFEAEQCMKTYNKTVVDGHRIEMRLMNG